MTESAGGGVRYLLADGLGSVRQAVDENANVVSYNEFDPYGNSVNDSGGDPYGYTGEWWENDIELLHLRARWYMPQDGVFLSRDPVESEPPYQYVRGNPIKYIDPSGMHPPVPEGPARPPSTSEPVPGGTPVAPTPYQPSPKPTSTVGTPPASPPPVSTPPPTLLPPLPSPPPPPLPQDTPRGRDLLSCYTDNPAEVCYEYNLLPGPVTGKIPLTPTPSANECGWNDAGPWIAVTQKPVPGDVSVYKNFTVKGGITKGPVEGYLEHECLTMWSLSEGWKEFCQANVGGAAGAGLKGGLKLQVDESGHTNLEAQAIIDVEVAHAETNLSPAGVGVEVGYDTFAGGEAVGGSYQPETQPYNLYPHLIGVRDEDADKYGGLAAWVYIVANVQMDEWILNADNVPQLMNGLNIKYKSCYSLTTYGEFDNTPTRRIFYPPPRPAFCTETLKAFTEN